MPLYFFHLRGGTLGVEADEGLEFSNDTAARVAALKGARSIISADILNGVLALSSRIDATDERGNLLFSLPFELAVTRSD